MSYFGKYQVSYFGRRPAKPSGANIMTRHSAVLEVDRLIPVDDTVKDLQPGTNDKASAGELAFASPVAKKVQFSQTVNGWCGGGGACRLCVVRLGLLDRRPISGLDR
jgi:hypothetical protein